MSSSQDSLIKSHCKNAAGWSTCFEGATGIAARKRKITLPADLAIDAEVDLCMTGGAYFLQARLKSACPVWSATSPKP